MKFTVSFLILVLIILSQSAISQELNRYRHTVIPTGLPSLTEYNKRYNAHYEASQQVSFGILALPTPYGLDELQSGGIAAQYVADSSLAFAISFAGEGKDLHNIFNGGFTLKYSPVENFYLAAGIDYSQMSTRAFSSLNKVEFSLAVYSLLANELSFSALMTNITGSEFRDYSGFDYSLLSAGLTIFPKDPFKLSIDFYVDNFSLPGISGGFYYDLDSLIITRIVYYSSPFIISASSKINISIADTDIMSLIYEYTYNSQLGGISSLGLSYAIKN